MQATDAAREPAGEVHRGSRASRRGAAASSSGSSNMQSDMLDTTLETPIACPALSQPEAGAVPAHESQACWHFCCRIARSSSHRGCTTLRSSNIQSAAACRARHFFETSLDMVSAMELASNGVTAHQLDSPCASKQAPQELAGADPSAVAGPPPPSPVASGSLQQLFRSQQR